jgi:rhodanese-related sulfurtransferase
MDAKQAESVEAELPLEISPQEAAEALARGRGVLLVDVREPWEHEICRIAGAKLIPMGTIPAHLQELDTDDQVICYCHHGMRSMDVAVWLRGQGVRGARSLAGGIERWSAEMDLAVPRY